MTATAHTDTFVRDNLPPTEEWPVMLFDRPELQFPARLNAAAELVDRAVTEGDGERVAILSSGLRWTYRDLQVQADRIARVLVEECGLVPGNRVLLRGPNSPMQAAAWLAVWKAGGVVVGTMPLLRAKELGEMIRIARVTHAVCDARLADDLEQARAAHPELREVLLHGEGGDLEQRMERRSGAFVSVDTAADDPALIAFTSGTTGVPKGTVHFHRDVLAMCEVFPRHCLKPSRDDVFIGTPPLAFTFGLGGLLCFPLRARAATVLVEKLTPELLLAAVQLYHATICVTSPTAYRQMTPLAAASDLHSLRKCVSAGEALPRATRDQWRDATGLQIYDGIGGTEMIHIYIASGPEDYRPDALGRLLPGYVGMIVDDAMRPLPPGEVGRLAIRGPTGCRYLADPRQRDYVRNGWNLPGDAFHMDADGYFYYHSRVDDMVVTSGYNVAPLEVEWALLGHPAVTECGVVGSADADRGQVVTAFVVLKPGFTEDEEMMKALQDFVKRTIAPYKYPRIVRFLPSLPRTETGKLQRYKLKALV